MGRTLLILLGPTGVGKTDYSIDLALKFGSPVISCDSRQIYRQMSIGTAVPDASQLNAVKHYFIHDHDIWEPYSAGNFEQDAIDVIEKLFDEGHETLVACGGSMFYIDALCNGLPRTPEADPSLRATLISRLKEEGAADLSRELLELDPGAKGNIDLSNGEKVLRALEVCIISGRPYSSFLEQAPVKRDFEIRKIGLSRPREELYRRIDSRVVSMMDRGLENEVRSLYRYKDLTALQTVGYREIFDHIDNPDSLPLERAVSLIQRNSRHYAKKQLTWWRRDPSIEWLDL